MAAAPRLGSTGSNAKLPGGSSAQAGDAGNPCAGMDAEKAGILQASGAALRLNPAGGLPAMRISGGAALQCDAAAGAAAAPAGQQSASAAAAVAAAAGGGVDNSQAKPTYSGVQKGPSSAADLALMCRRWDQGVCRQRGAV